MTRACSCPKTDQCTSIRHQAWGFSSPSEKGDRCLAATFAWAAWWPPPASDVVSGRSRQRRNPTFLLDSFWWRNWWRATRTLSGFRLSLFQRQTYASSLDFPSSEAEVIRNVKPNLFGETNRVGFFFIEVFDQLGEDRVGQGGLVLCRLTETQALKVLQVGVECVVCLSEGGVFVNIDVTTKILSKVAMDVSSEAEKAFFRMLWAIPLSNVHIQPPEKVAQLVCLGRGKINVDIFFFHVLMQYIQARLCWLASGSRNFLLI